MSRKRQSARQLAEYRFLVKTYEAEVYKKLCKFKQSSDIELVELVN